MKKLISKILRQIGVSESEGPSCFLEWNLLKQELLNRLESFEEERYLLERSIKISSEEIATLRLKLEEEKKAELAMKQERMLDSFSLINEGIIVYSLDKGVVYINNAGKFMLNASRFYTGTKFEQIFSPNANLDCVEAFGIENLESKEILCNLKTGSGSSFPVKLSVSSFDYSSQGTCYLLLFSNYTKELQIQAKLTQARDDAVEASRLKSDFVATMSHEIRTPLNGILSLSQLLSSSNLDPDQEEDVKGICSSASHLQTIIANILDFSKIEAGKLSLDYQNFSLPFLLKDVERLLSGIVSEKNLFFHIDIAKDVPRLIFGDSAKLRQILINLLGNAMKFTFERGAVLLIVRSKQVEGRTEVEFSIVDTGIGISEEKTKLIFEWFYQADSSITRNHGGTGLGLSISKKLIDLMGGQVSVKSREGIGSVFTVTIPVECSKSESPSYSRLEAVPLNGGQLRYASLSSSTKVLVVDDNLINRITTARYLDKKGFDTKVASSGTEAIEMLDQESFEIVLLDLHMPGMSGYEVSRLVRNSGRPYQGIPIVAISADVQSHVEEECLNVGINTFFSKPLNFQNLISKMEELVVKKQIIQATNV